MDHVQLVTVVPMSSDQPASSSQPSSSSSPKEATDEGEGCLSKLSRGITKLDNFPIRQTDSKSATICGSSSFVIALFLSAIFWAYLSFAVDRTPKYYDNEYQTGTVYDVAFRCDSAEGCLLVPYKTCMAQNKEELYYMTYKGTLNLKVCPLSSFLAYRGNNATATFVGNVTQAYSEQFCYRPNAASSKVTVGNPFSSVQLSVDNVPLTMMPDMRNLLFLNKVLQTDGTSTTLAYPDRSFSVDVAESSAIKDNIGLKWPSICSLSQRADITLPATIVGASATAMKSTFVPSIVPFQLFGAWAIFIF
jgi:hypothetical protein